MYLYIINKFHIRSCNSCSCYHRENKCTIWASTVLLIYILQKNYLTYAAYFPMPITMHKFKFVDQEKILYFLRYKYLPLTVTVFFNILKGTKLKWSVTASCLYQIS
jgi:hypothetical protein